MKLTITETFEDFSTTYAIEFEADEADLAMDILAFCNPSLLDEVVEDEICDCCEADTIDDNGYFMKFSH